MVIKRIIMTLLLSSLFCQAYAAVDAKLDRPTIGDHETVTLTISTDSNSAKTLELTPLQKDFTIYGTSRRHSVNMVNGNTSSLTQWDVTLFPKRTGKITIPAIQVGDEKTQPLTLQVLTAKQQQQKGDVMPAFLEAELKQSRAYVQQQLNYTVKLFTQVPIANGQLDLPEMSDARIESLGKDAQYTATKNGQQYNVYERRFAIFPKKSGTLTIPPAAFQGVLINNRPERVGFGFSSFNDNFGKPVRLLGKSYQIEIDAKPASFPADWWLPAKSVTLSETWSHQGEWRQGEPVTRTITLHVVGQGAEQLPKLTMPEQENISAYPDQPTANSSVLGEDIVGTRQVKVALVPQTEGKITLPAFEVHWWNVAKNKEEIVSLPERAVLVLPAKTINQTALPVQPVTETPKVQQTRDWFWPLIAGGFALLWLFTMLGFWWRKRQRRHKKVTADKLHTAKEVWQQLKQACQQQDAIAARRLLLQWANLHWPTADIVDLNDVNTIIDNEEFSEEINKLTASNYARDVANTWDGKRFWQMLRQALQTQPVSKQGAQEVLPPLYLK